MADLISPTTAAFYITSGLDTSPISDLACTGEVSISSESETYSASCLGSATTNQTTGSKTVTCSFSGKLDDSDAAPVDHIGETGLHTGGPCSIELSIGDTSNTSIKIYGYLVSWETSVGGDAASFSGELAITAEGTWS